MLICTTHFTRKKAAFSVILAGIGVLCLILLLGRSPAPTEEALPCLPTNEDRVAYLQSLGWEVSVEPVETLQFLLPAKLSGNYITYNELQKEQGFDLERCCGKQLTRCTYTVTNYPDLPDGVQLNLYLCDDIPVAGDVCCTGANGFQHTLVYPAELKEHI